MVFMSPPSIMAQFRVPWPFLVFPGTSPCTAAPNQLKLLWVSTVRLHPCNNAFGLFIFLSKNVWYTSNFRKVDNDVELFLWVHVPRGHFEGFLFWFSKIAGHSFPVPMFKNIRALWHWKPFPCWQTRLFDSQYRQEMKDVTEWKDLGFCLQEVVSGE